VAPQLILVAKGYVASKAYMGFVPGVEFLVRTETIHVLESCITNVTLVLSLSSVDFFHMRLQRTSSGKVLPAVEADIASAFVMGPEVAVQL